MGRLQEDTLGSDIHLFGVSCGISPFDFMDQQIHFRVQPYLHGSSALRLLRIGDRDFDLAEGTSVAAL